MAQLVKEVLHVEHMAGGTDHIKVVVSRWPSGDIMGMKITGHANEKVCAGVSALSQTIIYSLKSILRYPIQELVVPGGTQVIMGCFFAAKYQRARLLFDTLLAGLRAIGEEYPDQLVVEEGGADEPASS